MEIEQSVKSLLAPVWEDARKHKIPLYLQFEITSRCNLMCKMCYIASNSEENRKREMPASKWIDIARQARDMGLMVVNITGGEPVMKDDFWQLYDGLTNLGVIYTLNTNGTTMTKETVKRLAQAPPFRALVSIYGGSEETYARVTNNGKWFEQAKAGVENLLEAGIPVVLRMTLIKDNVDDLPKMFKWADSLGQDLFYSDYMSPRREGDETNPVGTRLDNTQRMQVKDTIVDLYRGRNNQQEEENRPQNDGPEGSEAGGAQPETKEDAPPEVTVPRKPYRFMAEDGFGCGAGIISGFVSYDGKLLPCGTSSVPFVSLRDKKVSDAWPELGTLTKQVPSCAECDACEIAKYCVPCPPKLMAESGSHCQKSAYLCEYAYYIKVRYESQIRERNQRQ